MKNTVPRVALVAVVEGRHIRLRCHKHPRYLAIRPPMGFLACWRCEVIFWTAVVAREAFREMVADGLREGEADL